MRNISFALTTPQVRARTKTVTRRLGAWWSKVLRKGDLLSACVKTQGIKAGGLERICVIRVEDVRLERLDRLLGAEDQAHGLRHLSVKECLRECEFEGFPDLTPGEFVEMFCRHMDCLDDAIVTRIEFSYVDPKCSYPWTACGTEHVEDCPMVDPRYGHLVVPRAPC